MPASKIPLPRVVLSPVSGSVTLKVRAYNNQGLSTTGNYTLSAATPLRVIVDSFLNVDAQSNWESIEWVSVEPSGSIYYNGGADTLGNSIVNTPSANDEVISFGQSVEFPDVQILNLPVAASTASVREVSTIAVNLTASTSILSVPGEFLGYHVNSTSSGVIKFWANTAASVTAITGNVTPAAGACPPIPPVAFSAGLYFQLVSGTIDITVFYRGA